jgi:hypothetical protein
MPLRLERNDNTIATVEDWFLHAPPMGKALQWRDGRSAKELAKAWCDRTGGPQAPSELAELLAQSQGLGPVELELGYPECRVPFDQVRGEPRNTDLALVGSTLAGRVAISVEAKADESFGRFLSEEILGAASQWSADEKGGKLERLQGLVRAVLPRRRLGEARLGELRYQLLTAIAGAWAFGSRVGCPTAILVVHEFVSGETNPGRMKENAIDLNRVVQRISGGMHSTLQSGQMIGPIPVPVGEMWAGVGEWYIGKCVTDLTLP